MHFHFLHPIILVDCRFEKVALLDQRKCVNVVQQFLEESIQILLLLREKCLVQYTFTVFYLYANYVVQVCARLQFIVIDLPCRLEHLNHDVVVNIVHEMGHFLMCEVKSMKSVFHTWKLCEFV